MPSTDIISSFTMLCQRCSSWAEFDRLSDQLQHMHDKGNISTDVYNKLCDIFQLYLMNYAKWFN